MSRLIVRSFGISLDGYGAGPDQSLDNPLGVGGPAIMEWFFNTRVWTRIHGLPDAPTVAATDNRIAEAGFENVGAWILGRNMFGPIRGPWPDDEWKGWWGDEPPYHVPAFVLTHHERAPLEMQGGTTFHFVTGGINEALERARAAANGKEIRLGGGVATVRQYLKAGFIDDMHLAVRPILLGNGESLFADLDLHALGYDVDRFEMGENAMHVFISRRS